MNHLDKLLKISLLSFGLFPILHGEFKGLPVGLLIISSIYYGVANKFKEFNIYIFLILSSLFIINILSVFNTFTFPVKKVETMLSLLLVPLAFSIIYKRLEGQHKKYFFLTFTLSSIILSIIHLIYYTYLGLFNEDSLKVNSLRRAVIEIPIFKDHPIYISIFLSISILLIPWIYKNAKLKIKIFFILGNVFCLVDLFLLSSKGVIIGLFLSSIVYILILFKKPKKIVKLSIVLSLVIIFVISIFHFPTLERRFRELNKKTTYTKIQPNNSTSIRIGIYQCVIKTIAKKPIFGYGLGNFPQKECYREASDHLYKINYNSHNQYLGYFLNAGIFGFLTLIGFLFYNFKIALNHKSYVYFIITLFFSIVMLIENILERQSGIILFIFMICFLNSISVNRKTI